MSRKVDCWDNAVAESFFATLEWELIEDADWHTREEARRDIFDYIEVWYNRQRLHSSLGYGSPAECEDQFALTPRAAANPLSVTWGEVHDATRPAKHAARCY